jgi:hypothetical protein
VILEKLTKQSRKHDDITKEISDFFIQKSVATVIWTTSKEKFTYSKRTKTNLKITNSNSRVVTIIKKFILPEVNTKKEQKFKV